MILSDSCRASKNIRATSVSFNIYHVTNVLIIIEFYYFKGEHSGSTFIQTFCDALKLEYGNVTNADEERNKRDLDQLFLEFVIPIVGKEAIVVDGGVRKQTPELRSSLVKKIRFRHQKNRPDILYREFDGGKEDGNEPQHRSLLDRFNNFRKSFFTK